MSQEMKEQDCAAKKSFEYSELTAYQGGGREKSRIYKQAVLPRYPF